jgi:hypothetical protein
MRDSLRNINNLLKYHENRDFKYKGEQTRGNCPSIVHIPRNKEGSLDDYISDGGYSVIY